jgi:hypothetical protein
MSDEDNFVKALRDIDCQREPPLHCTGHLHRMRIHGYVERKLVNGEHGSTWAWCLTDEGKLRAFPERGRLRVPVERVRFAVNYEAASWSRAREVLFKTRAARDQMRSAWYTPRYAKAISEAVRRATEPVVELPPAPDLTRDPTPEETAADRAYFETRRRALT